MYLTVILVSLDNLLAAGVAGGEGNKYSVWCAQNTGVQGYSVVTVYLRHTTLPLLHALQNLLVGGVIQPSTYRQKHSSFL